MWGGAFIPCLGPIAACLWLYFCTQVIDVIDSRLLFYLSVEGEEQYSRLEGGLVVT